MEGPIILVMIIFGVLMMVLFSLAFMAGMIFAKHVEIKKDIKKVEETVREEVDPELSADKTKDIKPAEKPTRSSVMHYPTPEEVRKGRAKEVVDTFFQHLIGGKEKKSGTISDPQGL